MTEVMCCQLLGLFFVSDKEVASASLNSWLSAYMTLGFHCLCI